SPRLSTNVQVTFTGPQLSVAVTPGSHVGIDLGLQPMSWSAEQLSKTGGVVSSVHVIFCEQVAGLPQPSFAVYVSVRVWTQPSTTSFRSQVTVAGPQLSVAAMAGSQPGIGSVGLQPRSTSGVGQFTNVGGVKSSVHVMCCTHVAVFPQP